MKKTAITIGKFDGMHRGHALLIENIVNQGQKGLNPVVLTFDISPRIALNKEKSVSKFLFTKRERDYIINGLGVDTIKELSFTDEMIKMEPEAFIEMLKTDFNLGYLCVGSDFRFGYKGRGDAKLLEELSRNEGFRLEIVDKLSDEDGDIISSSTIREHITNGNLIKANNMLGYDFFLLGEITRGNKIGTKLGMPTINISPDQKKLVVPGGVYISVTTIAGIDYPSVTNVGIRPTIKEQEKKLIVETHLLEFNKDVYEETAKVSFKKFLRDEKKFDSLEDLKSQIQKDTEAAIDFFK